MKYISIPVKVTDDILFELFKLNIPLMISFSDENNLEYPKKRIKILNRIFEKDKSIPITVTGEGTRKFKDSYEKIVSVINENISLGFNFKVFTTKETLYNKKPLFDILGKYRKDFIESCVFIDYNRKDKYFEIRNKQTNKKNPDVLYLFESDNSLLIFDDNGPQLFIKDDINNIIDLLVE